MAVHQSAGKASYVSKVAESKKEAILLKHVCWKGSSLLNQMIPSFN